MSLIIAATDLMSDLDYADDVVLMAYGKFALPARLYETTQLNSTVELSRVVAMVLNKIGVRVRFRVRNRDKLALTDLHCGTEK